MLARNAITFNYNLFRYMSDNLDKWKSILSQLEVDLLLFAGQNIKCPDSLLILESKNLQNFLEDNNFDFFQDSLSTLNQSQIDQFQSETKITLPQKYQEFCQVFGSGGFEPSECGIECPDIYNSQEQIRLNNYLLEDY